MDRSKSAKKNFKMENTFLIGLFSLFLCFNLGHSVPYSKYGRTCKDIGCRSNEICVMAEDPCSLYSSNQCGRYPTCKRSDDGGLSCSSMICESGKYCKTIDGRPTCVTTSGTLEYDSAGVSSVNGHRTNIDTNQNHGSSSSNFNPYSNANAPPPEPNHDTNYHPVNTPNNNGYPSYPSNSGNTNSGYPTYPRSGQNQPSSVTNLGYPAYPSNSGNVNSGYPPYPGSGNNQHLPSSGTNLGYPPYPTQNRMPQPGVYQQPGYHPGNLYPQLNNQQYPYQNNYNPHSRRPYHSSAGSHSPQILLLSLGSFITLIISKYSL